MYILCDKEYEHISSSAIRGLEKYGDGVVKNITLRYGVITWSMSAVEMVQ